VSVAAHRCVDPTIRALGDLVNRQGLHGIRKKRKSFPFQEMSAMMADRLKVEIPCPTLPQPKSRGDNRPRARSRSWASPSAGFADAQPPRRLPRPQPAALAVVAPEVGRKIRAKALKSLVSRKEKEAGEPSFRGFGWRFSAENLFCGQKARFFAPKRWLDLSFWAL
jgi:hypothetical protein